MKWWSFSLVGWVAAAWLAGNLLLDALLRASDLAEELTGTAPGGRAKAWLKPWLAKQA